MSSLLAKVKKLITKEPSIVFTPEHLDVLSILEDSNANLFLTGKAGTGKSTLIRHFRETTKKKVVVLAPTGLAALRVRGQTVHSFFRFPPRMLQKSEVRRIPNNSVYRHVDTIIIDEASMLRADVLDLIDVCMRINGRDKHQLFGGAQIVLVGDLFQLPPIVTPAERIFFQQQYETPYIFSADAFKQGEFEVRELNDVFRQREQQFIEILNMIRLGDVSMDALTPVNQQVQQNMKESKHLILCPTNAAVDRINQDRLSRINQPECVFQARIEGDFPIEDRVLPVELELHLKKGARVLFLKNDKGGQWVNGSLGTVHRVSQDAIEVKLDENNEVVTVYQDVWENIRYSYNEETGEVEATPMGKLWQYPLRLAWAITIHKSQGMTFDRVCIDFRRAPFAHGQTYVALSRCRSIDGLTLTRPLYPNDVIVDDKIIDFHRGVKKYSTG